MRRLLLAALVVMCGTTTAQADILIAPSEADNPGFRAALSTALGGETVDYFDARSATPTLAQLQGYRGVFTWANFAFNDNIGFGNNLADFVDGGGRVVLGAFTTYTSGNFLSGDIMGSDYSPVTSPTGTNFFTASSYAGDGTVLWDNVNSYTATYRDNVVLQGAGVLDGTFNDGAIAGAFRPDLGVIYIGGLETLEGGTVSGDFIQLLANAFDVGVVPVATPEPTMLALWSVLSAGGLGYGYRRWRGRLVPA